MGSAVGTSISWRRAPPSRRRMTPTRDGASGTSARSSWGSGSSCRALGGALALKLGERRPVRRGPVGPVHLVGPSLGEGLEKLAVARLGELSGDGAAGDLDDLVAVARPHEVRAHRLQVLLDRLNQDHLGSGAFQPLRLMAEPAAGGALEDQVERVARID